MKKYKKKINLSNWSGEEKVFVFKKYVDGRIKFQISDYIFELIPSKEEENLFTLLCDGEYSGISVYKLNQDFYSAIKYDINFSREARTPEEAAVQVIANLY